MDRFTWGIVAGTVVLVVVGLAAVLLVRRGPEAPDLSTPEGVVRAYVEAIDTGRPERAWDLLCERQQAEILRDEFVRRATLAYRSPREGRLAIEATTIEGNAARVELSRTYTSGGPPIFGPSTYTNRFTARLELERGRWCITVPPEEYRIFFERPAPPHVVVVTATLPTPTFAPTPTPVPPR